MEDDLQVKTMTTSRKKGQGVQRDEYSTKSSKTEFYDMAKMSNNFYYYITTNEISGELSPRNMISSQIKRSLLLWLHDELCLLQLKIFLSEMACR